MGESNNVEECFGTEIGSYEDLKFVPLKT